MSKRRIVIVSIIFVLMVLFVARTISQTQAGSGSGHGYYQPSAGNSGGIARSTTREQTDESKEASIKGAVGATDEQWAVIKSKLEKVRQLQRTACISIATSGGGSGGSQSRGGTTTGRGAIGGVGGSGFSGGTAPRTITERKQDSGTWMRWQWYKSWGSKPAQRQDEKACDALFGLLKNRNADPEEIRQRMNALRKTREQREQELSEARKELRDMLTLDQEARLVALGWLD